MRLNEWRRHQDGEVMTRDVGFLRKIEIRTRIEGAEYLIRYPDKRSELFRGDLKTAMARADECAEIDGDLSGKTTAELMEMLRKVL